MSCLFNSWLPKKNKDKVEIWISTCLHPWTKISSLWKRTIQFPSYLLRGYVSSLEDKFHDGGTTTQNLQRCFVQVLRRLKPISGRKTTAFYLILSHLFYHRLDTAQNGCPNHELYIGLYRHSLLPFDHWLVLKIKIHPLVYIIHEDFLSNGFPQKVFVLMTLVIDTIFLSPPVPPKMSFVQSFTKSKFKWSMPSRNSPRRIFTTRCVDFFCELPVKENMNHDHKSQPDLYKCIYSNRLYSSWTSYKLWNITHLTPLTSVFQTGLAF